MKLKFYLNKENKKIYTLKKISPEGQLNEAHYKFIKFGKNYIKKEKTESTQF